MAILAGIDEAGFGPLLGPLTVTATAFQMPDHLADESLWQVLAGGVTKKISKRLSAVVIGDSKRIYTSRGGKRLDLLERAVLACLIAGRIEAKTLTELLGAVCPASLDHMDRYPWYNGSQLALPHKAGADDLALAGRSLLSALNRNNMRLFSMSSEILFAGEYNKLVEATRNKSATLLDITCRLLSSLWNKAGQELLRVYVDRQGGRMRYLSSLQRVFRGCNFKIIEENNRVSAYKISNGHRQMEVTFAVKSEDTQLAVALASMTSKYLRELFMALLNRFWADRIDGLKPTAGYYVDGKRYLGQIAPAMSQLGCDPNILCRSR